MITINSCYILYDYIFCMVTGDDSASKNTAVHCTGRTGTDVHTEDKGGKSCDPDRETTGGAERGQETPLPCKYNQKLHLKMFT